MVEMLSVLAIIGVLSVGGIAGYSKAMEKHNLNKLKDQLFQIVSNISIALSSTPQSGPLSDAAAVTALHILPQEMGTPGLCRHALGGECYIGPVGSAGGTFSIRFRDLPPAACAEMATLDFSSFNINIYINAANNIAIGSSTCTTKDGETSCKYAVSRTIEQAAAECRGKLNTVSYIIHK